MVVVLLKINSKYIHYTVDMIVILNINTVTNLMGILVLN